MHGTRQNDAKVEDYLNESGNMKVEVELLLEVRGGTKGRRIFQIVGSQGPSDFLFVNTLRWERRLEEKRRREEEYAEHLVMWARQEY